MGYNKILVPLDGSKFAEQALEHLPKVANSGAHIELLTVLTEGSIDEMGMVAGVMGEGVTLSGNQRPITNRADDPQEVQARQNYLNQMADHLGQMGYKVTTALPMGRVVHTISNTSRADFDLVVLATHGRTGLSKFVLGSVSEGVLHEAACPVLIVCGHRAKQMPRH